MLQIYKDLEINVPADVEVSVNSRVFTVKGPRGTLTKVSNLEETTAIWPV